METHFYILLPIQKYFHVIAISVLKQEYMKCQSSIQKISEYFLCITDNELELWSFPWNTLVLNNFKYSNFKLQGKYVEDILMCTYTELLEFTK